MSVFFKPFSPSVIRLFNNSVVLSVKPCHSGPAGLYITRAKWGSVENHMTNKSQKKDKSDQLDWLQWLFPASGSQTVGMPFELGCQGRQSLNITLITFQWNVEITMFLFFWFFFLPMISYLENHTRHAFHQASGQQQTQICVVKCLHVDRMEIPFCRHNCIHFWFDSAFIAKGAIRGSACVRKSSDAVKSLFDFCSSTVFVREGDVGRDWEEEKTRIQNRRHDPVHADMPQT